MIVEIKPKRSALAFDSLKSGDLFRFTGRDNSNIAVNLKLSDGSYICLTRADGCIRTISAPNNVIRLRQIGELILEEWDFE